MQRMFVDRRKLARKRLLTVGAAIFGCLFVLLVVIIIVYSGNEISDTSPEEISTAEEITMPAPTHSPSPAPPPAPVYSSPASSPQSFPAISDDGNIQDNVEIAEAPAEAQSPADSEDSAEAGPETPADDMPEPAEAQENPDFDFALEACLAIYNAAQNWWYDLSEIQGLSDDIVINSFIFEFNLPEASVSTFESSATSVEIQGDFNDGKFVIDLVFADSDVAGYPKGINFVAWYSPENPYYAAWSILSEDTGDLNIQVELWDGSVPKAAY